MPAPSALAGLLDRARNVFSLAQQLGWAFQDARGTEGRSGQSDPTGWDRHESAFDDFWRALLDLRDAMQNPLDGFAPVAKPLREAARIAKLIRAATQAAGGQRCADYLDFFPHLNSVAKAGRLAIQDVTKAQRPDDPFAFVDQPAKGKDSGIDTTPTLPKPPAGYIEAAERAIPDILANVQPRDDRAIELVASELARKLQEAKHTLAAAHWAIHEAVQAGRLRPAQIERDFPEDDDFEDRREPVGIFGRVVRGAASDEDDDDDQETISVPEGKPAPFDSFKVVATESLWTLWHALDAAESHASEALTDAPENQRQGAPAVAPTGPPAPPEKPTDHPSIALLRVFTNGLSDDRIKKASRWLGDDTLTANEKLTKIDALIPFPATASAEQLGGLIGVTKQAVLKTDWWIENRKGEKDNEIGRRRAGHQKRARDYETPDSRDD